MDANALRKIKLKPLLVWLLLSTLSAALLIWNQLDDYRQRQNAYFEQISASLLKSLAQHDALLLLLNNDDRFIKMQKKFPQIIRLETLPSYIPVQDPLSLESPGRYWLNNHYRHVRLLIDTKSLINTVPQLVKFHHVAMMWQGHTLYQFGNQDGDMPWNWSRQLNYPSQPFTLLASSERPWRELSWGMVAACTLLWAVVIWGIWQAMQQNYRRKVADRRLHFLELTRADVMNEVTAGIAHELNQPLTAVMSYNQTAIRLIAMQQYQRIPEVLEASVVQLRRTSSLLQAWRDNWRNCPVEYSPVDIRLLWQRVEMLLEHDLLVGQVKMEYQFDAPMPALIAVPLWLEQIFHNLLSNAIQAQSGRSKSWVKVSVACVADQLKIDVSDGGPGLSAQALNHVFIPFFTTREGGEGLGMTLAETLILKLNGHIAVANHAGGGACFTLYLPLRPKVL